MPGERLPKSWVTHPLNPSVMNAGAELLPHQATFNWLVREEQVDAIMDGMTSPDLMERVDSQLRV